MTLSIGRFGLNPTLQSARAWNTGGDSIKVAGRFKGDTLADSLALRAQLDGLVDNPDEDAVPIVWSADPSVNGWYRVTGASCAMVGASLAHGLFEFTVDAVRIAPAPGHESAVTGRLVPNAHGISASTPWHAAPPGARGYEWPQGTTDHVNRGSADGSIPWRGASSYGRNTARWLLAPADAYKAACTLLVAGKPVVGHQLPAGHDADWELRNGLVWCRPSATHPGMIEVDHWRAVSDGDSGRTGYRRFRFRFVSSTYGTSLTDLHVLHNAPHRVTVRLNMGPDTPPSSRTLDLTIRRGSSWLYGLLVPVGGSPNDWKVATDGTISGATATTGDSGLAWTDGGASRIIVSAADHTIDLTGAGLAQVSGDPDAVMDFGIGRAAPGADGATYGTTSSQVRQYLAAMAEHPRVVQR